MGAFGQTRQALRLGSVDVVSLVCNSRSVARRKLREPIEMGYKMLYHLSKQKQRK
jgi:hypothetical protein